MTEAQNPTHPGRACTFVGSAIILAVMLLLLMCLTIPPPPILVPQDLAVSCQLGLCFSDRRSPANQVHHCLEACHRQAEFYDGTFISHPQPS